MTLQTVNYLGLKGRMCFSARRFGRAGRRVSVGPAEARAAACFSTLFPEIHHFSVEAGPSKSGKTRTAKVRGLNYHQSQSVSRLTEMGGGGFKEKEKRGKTAACG